MSGVFRRRGLGIALIIGCKARDGKVAVSSNDLSFVNGSARQFLASKLFLTGLNV